MRKLAPALFALAIIFTIVGCDSGSSAPTSRRSRAPEPVDTTPARTPPSTSSVLFRLPAVDGRTVSARGPVALFFFTSWCGYCKQAMPEFKRLAAQAQNKGWRVYGIDVNETPDKAEWFVQNYTPNFPVLMDQSGQVSAMYGVNGFPTFTLIDANGKVVYNGHELPTRF